MSWAFLQKVRLICTLQTIRPFKSHSFSSSLSKKVRNKRRTGQGANVDSIVLPGFSSRKSGHQAWAKSPYRIKQLRFSRHIMNLVHNGKMVEAVGLFDSMRESGVKAEAVVYNSLIGGFGKQGNIKESFRTFNQMKKHGLLPTDHTYSSILSACAEAGPRAEPILAKVESEMERRNIRLNNIGANAHISALASCRQQEDALKAYLNMIKVGTEPDLHTYSSLLLSSSKDRKAGLLVAQRVWEEMISSGYKPDMHCFNLLLQCLRDGGLEGTHTHTTEAVVYVPEVGVPSHEEEAYHLAGSAVTSCPIRVQQTGSFNFNLSRGHSLTVNLAIGFGAGVTTRDSLRWLDRLGVQTLFESLQRVNLKPDIRLFHLLIQLVLCPEAVLRHMEECGVRPDERVAVAAVRAQTRLGNLAGGKTLLGYFRALGVDVGQSSYQALATCCSRESEGLKLLEEMKASGVTINEYVFGTLIGRALRRRSYEYATALLKKMRHYEVLPSDTITDMLETAASTKPKSPSHVTRHNGFKGYYEIWKKLMIPQDTT